MSTAGGTIEAECAEVLVIGPDESALKTAERDTRGAGRSGRACAFLPRIILHPGNPEAAGGRRVEDRVVGGRGGELQPDGIDTPLARAELRVEGAHGAPKIELQHTLRFACVHTGRAERKRSSAAVIIIDEIAG